VAGPRSTAWSTRSTTWPIYNRARGDGIRYHPWWEITTRATAGATGGCATRHPRPRRGRPDEDAGSACVANDGDVRRQNRLAGRTRDAPVDGIVSWEGAHAVSGALSTRAGRRQG
jgi:hypothetical protein